MRNHVDVVPLPGWSEPTNHQLGKCNQLGDRLTNPGRVISSGQPPHSQNTNAWGEDVWGFWRTNIYLD